MYLIQLSITAADAKVLVSEDLYQLRKALPPAKCEMRTAVELLVDIFKDVGTEE